MNTHFALLAKFGDVNIPLDKVCKDFFGMEPRKANERACRQDLPVPTFKLGGSRSPWLVDAIKLAEYIDRKKIEAENDWQRIHTA